MNKIILFSLLVASVFTFNLRSVVDDQNQDILQQLLNGVYEQNKLADTTTIIPCVDADTAAKIVAFIPGFLQQASSVLHLPAAVTSLENFAKTLPQSVGDCLKGNKELDELAAAYNLIGADPSAIESKVKSYVIGHLKHVTSTFGVDLNEWNGQQYDQAGQTLAQLGHDALSIFFIHLRNYL